MIKTRPITRSSQGVQAFVGMCEYLGEEAVYKYSRQIDYVIELEYSTTRALESLKLPHFSKVLGMRTKEDGRPCLFMKYIPHGSLAQFILRPETPRCAILPQIYQSLAAICMYTEILGITHYDPHSDNVMMDKTPYDIHAYKFPDGEVYAFNTHGWCPVIIDMGLSYLPGSPTMAPISFSHHGFTPFCADKLVDTRLLLRSALNDMDDCPGTKPKMFAAYRKAFNKIFNGLDMDECGWFPSDTFCDVKLAISQGLPLEKSGVRASSIFDEYTLEYTLEILLSEMVPPFRYREATLEKDFMLFYAEWIEIENTIRNGRKELQFLKDVLAGRRCGEKLKHHLNRVIMGIENLMVGVANNTEEKRRSIYKKLSVSQPRDVLRMLPIQKPKYTKGARIKLFDGTKTYEVVLTDAQAKRLKRGDISVDMLF